MIKIICVGKIKEQYLKDAILEYMKRISKYHKLEIIELPDNSIEEEGNAILKVINDKDYVITLEIEGQMIDSIEFSNRMEKIFIEHSNITFIIGGSDGLSDKIKAISNFKLSFSKMTFPHQLFRVILLEQIYRAFKIMKNETYHK